MKNILVIGDLIFDEYIYGTVERLCQEAPVPILSMEQKFVIPGGAGNVSLNVAKANIPVNLLTVVGEDLDSIKLIEILKNENVDTSMSILNSNQQINKKMRFISCDYVLLRVDNEKKIEVTTELENTLLNVFSENIAMFDIVILSDYNKGVLTKSLVKKIIKISIDSNIKVLADVKGNDAKKYTGAYLLKPNIKELSELTNLKIDTYENIIKAASKLCRKCKSKYVLVTLGDKGMLLIDDSGFNYFVEGTACFNPQVVGAGDTTIAYVAFGLFHNLPITEIIDIASTAASLVIRKPMTSYVSYDELVLKKKISNQIKILCRNDLQEIIKLNTNKKIVFTNGCFDILHMGHINLLKEASIQGDMLIVAVDTDDSVAKIKGNHRPIQQLSDRMTTLSLLEYVDYVISFDTSELLELVEMIHPDIIVKNDEYANRAFRGSQLVESWGGRVHIVNSKYKNISTSIIVNSILKKYSAGDNNGTD